MIYLRRFTIPSRSREEARLYCNAYPFGVFPRIGLHTIECAEVTVFCGGNGTGKTTLLNVIAETLRLPRLAAMSICAMRRCTATGSRRTVPCSQATMCLRKS